MPMGLLTYENTVFLYALFLYYTVFFLSHTTVFKGWKTKLFLNFDLFAVVW